MNLHALDWAIVAAYFAFSTIVGLVFTKRGGESLNEYFLSGRDVPWWLAGTSMVATTFAADTPLLVTGLVANHGVAGNWLWWNMVMSGMLTVFFFARLWRRSGVMTDVEFAEVRYSGKPAALLRGFRAIYLAIPINLIIMGWVTKAMIKILSISLGIDPWAAVLICFAVTMLYAVAAGLWAVLWTDLIQFVIKMTAVIILAVFAVVLGFFGTPVWPWFQDYLTGEQAATEPSDEGDEDGRQDDPRVVCHIVPDTADDVGVDVDPDRDGLGLEGLFAAVGFLGDDF